MSSRSMGVTKGVQLGYDAVGDLVPVMLDLLDLLDALGHVVPLIDEFGKLVGRQHHVAGALLEEVEEPLFLGYEREPQCTTSPYID